jgi:hypothetical protein
MLGRALTAFALALLGSVAATGSASAAVSIDDRDDVMILVAVVALVMMAVLFLVYLVKHALGLDKMPPPAPDAHDGHH